MNLRDSSQTLLLVGTSSLTALVRQMYNVLFVYAEKVFGYYPLANEVVKEYSTATVRPSVRLSFRNILVNTLESTSFNGF